MPFDVLTLARLASRTVVAAAATDAWEAARRGFARLLSRGDPERERLAEQRLDQTREQLQAAVGQDVEQARARLEAVWQVRLADLLDERPELAGDLQALVDQVRAELPAGAVMAVGHGVAAGGDVNITAAGGSVAAGTVQGNVSAGNPTFPGPANG